MVTKSNGDTLVKIISESSRVAFNYGDENIFYAYRLDGDIVVWSEDDDLPVDTTWPIAHDLMLIKLANLMDGDYSAASSVLEKSKLDRDKLTKALRKAITPLFNKGKLNLLKNTSGVDNLSLKQYNNLDAQRWEGLKYLVENKHSNVIIAVGGVNKLSKEVADDIKTVRGDLNKAEWGIYLSLPGKVVKDFTNPTILHRLCKLYGGKIDKPDFTKEATARALANYIAGSIHNANHNDELSQKMKDILDYKTCEVLAKGQTKLIYATNNMNTLRDFVHDTQPSEAQVNRWDYNGILRRAREYYVNNQEAAWLNECTLEIDWDSHIGDSIVQDLRIVPLNSAKALHREGKAMQHCVGGYYYRCTYAQRMSRIFSVKNENDERVGTLELVSNEGVWGPFRLGTILDRRNRQVSRHTREVCNEFVTVYNNHLQGVRNDQRED